MSFQVSSAVPTLPQQASPEVRQAREFQLATARTNYNYMRSYLDAVPMSADLPGAERFSLDYEAQVLKVFVPMLENFKQVVTMLLEREIQGDLPTQAVQDISAAWEKFDRDFSPLHPIRDAKDLHALLKALSELPPALKTAMNLPKDIEAMVTGLDRMFKEMLATGPTAFLKSTLYDMLSADHGRAYLHAESIADYAALFPVMPTPMALALERQPWMPAAGEPCEQDWFFGHLQIAGFNTTQLRAVLVDVPAGSVALALADLQRKMPVTDEILQQVSGRAGLTLAQAARDGHLHVVDYT